VERGYPRGYLEEAAFFDLGIFRSRNEYVGNLLLSKASYVTLYSGALLALYFGENPQAVAYSVQLLCWSGA